MTDKPKDDSKSQNAVLYVSRIPYGFDDKSAWDFFSQFGSLKGISYPRSSKTGRSKGYMFLLFDDRDVALECAKAMHNYYMFGKEIKTKVLPESHKIIYDRFKAQPKKFKFVPWQQIFKKGFKSNQSEEHKMGKLKKLVENDEKKVKRLSELGIVYSFPMYRDLIKN